MIVRKKRTSGYGAVPNAPFERDDLTWEAKGLLVYLLLKPDNWRIDPKDIAERGKTARSKPGAGTGRDKVYALLKELVEARYVRRVYVRDERGVVESVEYHAYDEPHEEDASGPVTPKAEMDPLPPKAETAEPDLPKAEIDPLPPKADLPKADLPKAHLRINTNSEPITELKDVAPAAPDAPHVDAWADVKSAISALFGGLTVNDKDGALKSAVGQTIGILGKAADDDPAGALALLREYAASKDHQFCNGMYRLHETVGSWIGKRANGHGRGTSRPRPGAHQPGKTYTPATKEQRQAALDQLAAIRARSSAPQVTP